jgi:hypothetical protein
LEALNESLQGRSVLMVDDAHVIGGAWSSISLFGYSEVENAVHYLLPSETAVTFLNEVIAVPVVRTAGKFRALSVGRRRFMTPYDSPASAFFSLANRRESMLGRVRSLLAGAPGKGSFYFAGGSPSFIARLQSMIEMSRVQIRLQTKVLELSCEEEELVRVTLSDGIVFAKKVIITHGTKIPAYRGIRGSVEVAESLHPRPAAHVLISNCRSVKVRECIFVNDSQLKYVHDVTDFSSTFESDPTKRIIAAAFHPEVSYSYPVIDRLLGELQKVGMADSDSRILDHHWQSVYLPSLDDAALRTIASGFAGRVIPLRTESLSHGIAENAYRWSSLLAFKGALPNSR